jgi:hypothetical protein
MTPNEAFTEHMFALSGDQMAHIYSDLKLYADQHGGQFPAKLSDLVIDGYETDPSWFHHQRDTVDVRLWSATRAQQAAIVEGPYFTSYYYFGSGLSLRNSPDTVLLAENPVDIIRPDDNKNHVVDVDGQIVIVGLARLNAIVREHGITQRRDSAESYWPTTLR